MNKLEELRKLAEATKKNFSDPLFWKMSKGFIAATDDIDAQPFFAAANPQTILALLDLVELQHEAILWNWGGEPLPTKERAAIAAYNKFKEQS